MDAWGFGSIGGGINTENMKYFIDSANLIEIEETLKRGFIEGVTTNPSLLSKEPRSSFEHHIESIIGLLETYRPGTHLSVEVFSTDSDEIVSQALRFKQMFSYPALSVKVQVGWNELGVIHRLAREGISVNCTAIMSVSQAMMAAKAGAKYVSIFWGRIRDAGVKEENKAQKDDYMTRGVTDMQDFDPFFVTQSVRTLLDDSDMDTEIIVGSIRSVTDIRNAALAGAHIITTPPKFFPDMIKHFKTDEVVKQFMADFQTWMQ